MLLLSKIYMVCTEYGYREIIKFVMRTALCFEDQEKSNTHALKSFMHDLLVV